MTLDDEHLIAGYVDEYRDGRIHGWAWRPSMPLEMVAVEILVDGVIVAETVACLYRADLEAAGIGDGSHAFAVPVDLDVDRLSADRVMVRVKDEDELPGGKLPVDRAFFASLHEESVDPDIASFITSVLKGTRVGRHPAQSARLGETRISRAAAHSAPLGQARISRDAAQTATHRNFVVYSSTAADSRAASLGAPEGEYSDYFVMRAFEPVLRRFGTVHVVSDPANEVDRIRADCLARGEDCLFLYFGPPHRLVPAVRCPTVPVMAWGFSTIPSEVWNDDVRNDWRRVLHETGRAITLSKFAAEAVRKAMGEHFPVLAVPAPVWDRSATARVKAPLRATDVGAEVEVEGFILDTRGRVFRIGEPPSSPPRRAFKAATGRRTKTVPIERATLDGVVFTSVLAPSVERKNWQDMLTGFVAAFSETPDATLVFKMVGREPAYWWWDFHSIVSRLPAFACRVVVLHGFLDDDRYAALIGATHWVVNSSLAEGLCLPLLEFMCAGRPALAPAHTAMADYIEDANALIVRSEEECCSWPHDPRNHLTTSRHRIEWCSVRDAMREAYRITKTDWGRYAAMSEGAMVTMRRFCADVVVAEKIGAFLDLDASPSSPARRDAQPLWDHGISALRPRRVWPGRSLTRAFWGAVVRCGWFASRHWRSSRGKVLDK
jgi:glycosyltransferase involved in cell wall biosynthesis